MLRRTDYLRGAALVAALLLPPHPLAAQRRNLEAYYGRWLNGNDAASYEFRSSTPFWGGGGRGGTLTHGFGATVLVRDSLGRHRAFYGFGYELQAFRHRATLGPYALLGVELGLSTDTSRQELGALWSAGAGLEWRPVSRFAFGAEARWRLEDRGPRGFWRPGDAHRGLAIAIGASLGLGPEGGGEGGAAAVARRRGCLQSRPRTSPERQRMWFAPR